MKNIIILYLLLFIGNGACYAQLKTFVSEDSEHLIGYKNAKGNIVIPASYKMAYDFAEGLAVVEKYKISNGKKIAKNVNNQYFYETEYFVINEKGVIQFSIPKPKSDFFYTFHHFANKRLIIEQDGKVGALNEKGEIVIQPQYQSIKNFKGNVAIATKEDLSNYGLIDLIGKIVIPFDTYKSIIQENSYYLIAEKDSETFTLNNKGEIISDLEGFRIYSNFQNGSLKLEKDKKFGYLDSLGKIVFKPQFDDVVYYQKPGTLFCKQNNKWALVNPKKTNDLAFVYETIEGSIEEIVISKLNGKWIGLDTKKQNQIEYAFEELAILGNAYLLVRKKDKYGVIDVYNKKMIDFIYDNIQAANLYPTTLFKVTQNGKYGLADKKGKVLGKGIIYQEIRNYSEGFVAIKINNLWGFVNEKGEIVIEPNLDECKNFRNGKVNVRLNKEWYILNTKGDVVK
jgi:hypothetical protein